MIQPWLGYPEFHADLVVAMAEDMRRGDRAVTKIKLPGFHTTRASDNWLELTPKGDAFHSTKVTDAQVEEIRNLHKIGHTGTRIASIFGIGKSQVYRILAREQR